MADSHLQQTVNKIILFHYFWCQSLEELALNTLLSTCWLHANFNIDYTVFSLVQPSHLLDK